MLLISDRPLQVRQGLPLLPRQHDLANKQGTFLDTNAHTSCAPRHLQVVLPNRPLGRTMPVERKRKRRRQVPRNGIQRKVRPGPRLGLLGRRPPGCCWVPGASGLSTRTGLGRRLEQLRRRPPGCCWVPGAPRLSTGTGLGLRLEQLRRRPPGCCWVPGPAELRSQEKDARRCRRARA